jgi:hypothetical protein
MNRRDFLKLSGAVIANMVFLPICSNGRPAYYIESEDDFIALKLDSLEPGATVYWREGTYNLMDQVQQVYWTGTGQLPIVSRPYKKENVVINGCINPRGPHQQWRSFDISSAGVYEGFMVDAPYTTIENNIVHDCNKGIRASTGDDHYLVVKDNEFYNLASHGIYWNGTGAIIDNNSFMSDIQGSAAIHCYGGPINNLTITNNSLDVCGIIVCSGQSISNVKLERNNLSNSYISLDYEGTGGGEELLVRWNDLFNSQLKVHKFISGEVTHNTIDRDMLLVLYEHLISLTWDYNQYYQRGTYFAHDYTKALTFLEWQEKYGYDLNSEFVLEQL